MRQLGEILATFIGTGVVLWLLKVKVLEPWRDYRASRAVDQTEEWQEFQSAFKVGK